MLAIISAVAAFFNAIRALIGLQNRQADRDAGAAEAVVNGNKQADETISEANDAREDVRSELARDPDRLRDEDEFSRPD
jgi:uncharacterized membrane protein